MDPTTVCCPNGTCPARGHAGQGHIGIHARKDKRVICAQGHTTCTATQGPVFARLRTAAALITIVGTLRAHDCPLQASVAALGFDERTVAAWRARAGRQGQSVKYYTAF